MRKNNTENILKKEISMFFSQEFKHKQQLFAWIMADFVKIIGLCVVWIASVTMSGSASQGYIVTYYLLLVLIGKFTQDLTPEVGVRDILTGKISVYFLKPLNYLYQYFCLNIGQNILKIILFIPAFVIGCIVANSFGFWTITFSPYVIFIGCLGIILAFCVNFILGNIFSLLSFYFKNMDGLRIFYFNIASLLSGEFIPFIILSTNTRFVLELLPFRYTLSFPIEIMMGRLTNYELQYGFTIGCIWLAILILVYIIFYKRAIKRYAAEGI